MKPAAETRPFTIGFVTTCKGRLHHLEQTLPLIAAQKPDEIIVVDYDCPQGAGEWVGSRFPEVRVIYVNDGGPFVLSRARNHGIQASSSDFLCLIDADILVSPGFVDWIKANVNNGHHYRHHQLGGLESLETWGTVICPRSQLIEIGQYDEAFDGWGGEDDDLYKRLRASGSVERTFPKELIMPISHGEKERFSLYDSKKRRTHLLANRLYSSAKSVAQAFSGLQSDLPLELRKDIRKEVKKALALSEDMYTVTMDFTLVLKSQNEVKKSIRIELSVSKSMPLIESYEDIELTPRGGP